MKKHIGFLLAVSVAVVGLYAAVASASTLSSKATQSSKAVVVTVTMTNYHFKFSKTTGYKHGVAYTFKTVNKGTAPHNLDFQGVKAGTVIAPGKTKSFTLTFKKKGNYQYLCDVPRHAELGMSGLLKVA
jgi:plastocyanin